MTYGMCTRNGDIVIKTNAGSLEEVIGFFSKMKQLPRKEFLKLFIVTKI